MQRVQNKTRSPQTFENEFSHVLCDVKTEDWSLIASLTQDIKSDSGHIPRLLELRAKIRSGIYHVDKDLIIDSILKRIYPQPNGSE